MDAASQVIEWLRKQPDVWRRAAYIAEAPHDEFEYGDAELADAVEMWLFSQYADEHLVNNLGMSPTLRNQTAKEIDQDKFYEIQWDKVREVLIEEDGPDE